MGGDITQVDREKISGPTLPEIGPLLPENKWLAWVYRLPTEAEMAQRGQEVDGSVAYWSNKGKTIELVRNQIKPDVAGSGELVGNKFKGITLRLFFPGEREKGIKVERGSGEGFMNVQVLAAGKLTKMEKGELIFKEREDGGPVIIPLPGQGVVLTTFKELKSSAESLGLITDAVGRSGDYLRSQPWEAKVAV